MINDFFNSDVSIEQLAVAQSPMGGQKKSYSERIASLACRITPKKIIELDEFGKMTVRMGLRLYCEATSTNLEIDESDRVKLGTRTFQIKTIGNPALLNRHLEIDILEIV